MIEAGLSLGVSLGSGLWNLWSLWSLFAPSAGGDLPLGINLWNLVAQMVTFFVVLIVLAKWVFPIFTKTLDQRTRVIQEGVENTERSRRELAEAQRRIEGLLEEARQQAQQTLAQATTAGEHLRTEIEQEAQARAKDILAQADKRIQQEIAQARAELRQQVADLAILAAERVIGHSLDSADNRRLVNEFVTQSRDLQ
jgi:F-type H+-transporting ATPase subunit b